MLSFFVFFCFFCFFFTVFNPSLCDSNSSHDTNVAYTVFTLSIRTPQLLTIVEQVPLGPRCCVLKLLVEKKTMLNLIRRRFLWRLIWVNTVCKSLTVQTFRHSNNICWDSLLVIACAYLVEIFTITRMFMDFARSWKKKNSTKIDMFGT